MAAVTFRNHSLKKLFCYTYSYPVRLKSGRLTRVFKATAAGRTPSPTRVCDVLVCLPYCVKQGGGGVSIDYTTTAGETSPHLLRLPTA